MEGHLWLALDRLKYLMYILLLSLINIIETIMKATLGHFFIQRGDLAQLQRGLCFLLGLNRGSSTCFWQMVTHYTQNDTNHKCQSSLPQVLLRLVCRLQMINQTVRAKMDPTTTSTTKIHGVGLSTTSAPAVRGGSVGGWTVTLTTSTEQFSFWTSKRGSLISFRKKEDAVETNSVICYSVM